MPTESDKKPTFRLYFTIKDPPGFTKKPHQPGKTPPLKNQQNLFSFISTTAVVTPKFYAKQAELPALMTEAELAAKIALFITEPPQKKYKNPPTENQTCVFLCFSNKFLW